MTEFWLDGTDEGKALGDLVVMGKSLRDWQVADFTGDVAEMMDFEENVWAATTFGDHLHEVMGQEFHDDFYSRRHDLIARKRSNDASGRMTESVKAHVGGRLKIKLLHMFQVPHVGWEMDNDYGVFEVNGVVRLFGTEHGCIREFDYPHLMQMKMNLEESMAGVDGGLSILAEAARATR